MEEILNRSRIQTWNKDGVQEILISCTSQDFVALVRNRNKIPQLVGAESAKKIKVTLTSDDDRVTSFEILGNRVKC